MLTFKKSYFIFSLFIFIISAVSSFSQTIPQNPNRLDANGKKTGKWTVLYNQNWQVVQDTAQASFYRVANYREGKPIGKVKDYFKNGRIQMEADSIASEEPEIFDGLAISYFPSGRIESFKFYIQGKINYAKTEAQYLYQLTQDEKKAGKLSPTYFNALSTLVKFYTDNGNYIKAEPLQNECTFIIYRLLGEKHPNYGTMLYNLALIYRSMGNFALAEENYLKVKKIRQENLGEKHPAYATVLNDLGKLYASLGNFTRAEPLFRQSMNIRKEVLGDKHRDYATALNDLADLYYKIGNYNKAEELYLQSAQVFLETLGANHEYYATSLNNLANLYQAIENPRKALSLMQEANDIYLKQLGEKNPQYATSLNNLAQLYRTLGRYEKAQNLQNQALQIRKETLGEEHPDYANSLHNVGLLEMLKGNYEKAEKELLHALFLRKNVLGEFHPDYSETLRVLSHLYMITNQYARAEPLFREANLILLKQKETYFPVLSEQEKEDFYNNKIRLYFEEYNSFVLENYHHSPNLLREMYNNQLATKAVLLNDSNKWKDLIINSKDTLLLAKFNQWRNLKSYLTKIQSEQKNIKENLQLDSLENLSNLLEKELSERSAYFSKMTENKRFTWLDVRSKLGKEEAAVEIIRFRKYGIQRYIVDSSSVQLTRYPQYGLTDSLVYVALVLTPKTLKNPELVIISQGSELEKRMLNYYRNRIKFRIRDQLSYEKYWLPIASKLRQSKKIFFSPDGVYNQINLNTLYNYKEKRYLLEEKDIFLLTNTQDLMVREKTDFKNKVSLFFGSPNFNLDGFNREKIVGEQRSSESQRSYYVRSVERSISVERSFSVERSVERSDDQNLQPGSVERQAVMIAELPGTKKEVVEISGLFKSKGFEPILYMDNEALEENLKDIFNPGILHIATHGFFEDDLDYDGNKKNVGNPLIRSGLLLTGSAHSLNNSANGNSGNYIEDGILTAFEAMNLHLNETELVVLSACETGLGEVKNGEGVYGLQRAFKVAGAKSIIMSLWKVDDTTTQELMYLFYQNWLNTQNKHLAFKQAQLTLQQKYPDVYFWGAFILVGAD